MENIDSRMDVDQIRLFILERKDEIKEKFKAEVLEISGSYVPGEDKNKSDIKVYVRFEERATLLHLAGLAYYLEGLFGFPVNIVSERALTLW